MRARLYGTAAAVRCRSDAGQRIPLALERVAREKKR
jgi:hypothetical protein